MAVNLSGNQVRVIQNLPTAAAEETGFHSDGPLWLGAPAPNPTMGTTRCGLYTRSLLQSAQVLDLGGRVLRGLPLPGQGATRGDATSVTWDGCLANGLPAPAGVYLLRVETRQDCSTRRIILCR